MSETKKQSVTMKAFSVTKGVILGIWIWFILPLALTAYCFKKEPSEKNLELNEVLFNELFDLYTHEYKKNKALLKAQEREEEEHLEMLE